MADWKLIGWTLSERGGILTLLGDHCYYCFFTFLMDVDESEASRWVVGPGTKFLFQILEGGV